MDTVQTDKRCGKHPEVDPKFVLTPEGHHHGKWICASCSKFLTWAKSPRVTKELLERQRAIRALITENKLGDRDLHKLLEMYTTGTLGLVQRQTYDRLTKRN